MSAFAVLAGCDDKEKTPPKPSSSASSAASTAAPAPTPTAPAAPSKPQFAIDDTAVFVAGERFETAPADLRGRLVAAIGDKPVAGETVVLNAARETKLPKVVALFSALVAKKVKGVEVHTARRDKSMAEVTFVTNMKPADCSAVGSIAKEGFISVWPANGAGAADRFARGMAGPDITRGSEGLRKRLTSCDSPVFFLTADESITWGLLFDLELAATGNEDGGAALAKPRSPSLLTKPAVAGHKIEVETPE
ncbi:MAG: hypothetical protein JST00_05770 [Deltaproteobacteria bacterium]|nr:hypothetical protein [Deltaproteobacteria bacterium]